MVTVDYYSDFWEGDYLEDTQARTLIRKLKANFARSGIPDCSQTMVHSTLQQNSNDSALNGNLSTRYLPPDTHKAMDGGALNKDCQDTDGKGKSDRKGSLPSSVRPSLYSLLETR